MIKVHEIYIGKISGCTDVGIKIFSDQGQGIDIYFPRDTAVSLLHQMYITLGAQEIYKSEVLDGLWQYGQKH